MVCAKCRVHFDMHVFHHAGAEGQGKGQAHAWAEQRESLEERGRDGAATAIRLLTPRTLPKLRLISRVTEPVCEGQELARCNARLVQQYTRYTLWHNKLQTSSWLLLAASKTAKAHRGRHLRIKLFLFIIRYCLSFLRHHMVVRPLPLRLIVALCSMCMFGTPTRM